jgi:hypothetical protein
MKSKQSISVLLILFMVVSSSAFLLFLNNKKAGNDEILAEDRENSTEKDYDNFRAEHVSVIRKKHNKPHFVLTADEIIHRKRFSKLFLYQNLKEIYISGAKIDIYLNNRASSGNNLLPVDEMNDIFRSLGKQPTSLNDYYAGKVADSDLDLLSRIYFENLSLNIYYTDRKKISFSALYAAVTPDLNNLVFSGTVQFTDSMRRKFISSKVVWSKKHNGIYFPEGYTLHNSQLRNESFYALNKDGDFTRLWNIPAIEYADYLEVAESRLYAKLMKKLPPYAKMMLGLPIQ